MSKNFNGLSFVMTSGFCGMARSSGSKRSEKDDSDSDSEDEVTDDLDSLRKENSKLNDLLDNRDVVLRDAKKQRKDSVTELESNLLDAKLEIDSLKAAPVVTDEIDCEGPRWRPESGGVNGSR